MLWRASKASIACSVRSAMKIVADRRFASVAFPVIGAGSGGFDTEGALAIMMEAFGEIDAGATVVVVRCVPRT